MRRRKAKKVGEVSIRRTGENSVEFKLELSDQMVHPLKDGDLAGHWLSLAAYRLQMAACRREANPTDRLTWDVMDDPRDGLKVEFTNTEPSPPATKLQSTGSASHG